MAFDPLTHPFTMPFVRLPLRAKLSGPVRFYDAKSRGTAGTTFHGVLKKLIHQRLDTSDENLSAWLTQPASRPYDTKPESAGLPLATRPLYLRSAHLDGVACSDEVPLVLDAVGHKAIDALPRFLDASLAFTISPNGVPVKVLIEPPDVIPSGISLMEAAQNLRHENDLRDRLLMEFATTCVFATGGKKATPEAFDVLRLFGDVIRQTVLFDLADKDITAHMSRQELAGVLEDVQQHAAIQLQNVDMAKLMAVWVEHGDRFEGEKSRLSAMRGGGPAKTIRKDRKGVFAISGIRGYWEWTGDLSAALPWATAMSVLGVGGRRSYGCGEINLWFPG